MYPQREPRIAWQRGSRRVYQIAGIFTATGAQIFFNGLQLRTPVDTTLQKCTRR